MFLIIFSTGFNQCNVKREPHQVFRGKVSQSVMNEGGLLITHHILPSLVAHHQLRPHGPLTTLLQGHLQAGDRVGNTKLQIIHVLRIIKSAVDEIALHLST